MIISSDSPATQLQATLAMLLTAVAEERHQSADDLRKSIPKVHPESIYSDANLAMDLRDEANRRNKEESELFGSFHFMID